MDPPSAQVMSAADDDFQDKAVDDCGKENEKLLEPRVKANIPDQIGMFWELRGCTPDSAESTVLISNGLRQRLLDAVREHAVQPHVRPGLGPPVAAALLQQHC
ncbi:hypothetical protein U9M48_022672 [Paspalum notatum var. saurae]|uniref:Uncharacterized protein n=1 Tax=Paspalum notatum var. saurae TaxID=547442 RepID=A0AAQ3TKA7_PASNO